MLTLYNHIPKVLRFKQMCIGMQTFRRHETHPYFSPKTAQLQVQLEEESVALPQKGCIFAQTNVDAWFFF